MKILCSHFGEKEKLKLPKYKNVKTVVEGIKFADKWKAFHPLDCLERFRINYYRGLGKKMTFKSTWTASQISEAENLLKLHHPRVVAETIGRTEKAVRNKFYSKDKLTKPGASMAEKAACEKIPCLGCRNLFQTWSRAKNRFCGECKKNSGSRDSHRLNLSGSGRGGAE